MSKEVKIDLSNILEITNEVFHPLFVTDKRYNILRGSAGSGKSIFMVQLLLIRLLSRQKYNILVVRKFGCTLRKSVLQEFRNMIIKWDIMFLFKINRSDGIIQCLNNGNTIYFSGLDSPEKIKSLESEVVDIWMEEASEFNNEDFDQLDLRLRGYNQYKFQIFLSFNPVSIESWLKKTFYDNTTDLMKSELYLNFSTYLDNKFLDLNYKNVLASKRYTNPLYYQIYCLGNWGTTGKLIYTNYEVHDFPYLSMIYDKVYSGIDFGFTDPFAMVSIAIKDDEIYVFDEFYETGITTADFVKHADVYHKYLKTHCVTIFCDCAEPDRIVELQRAGYLARKCDKKPNYKKAVRDFISTRKIHILPVCREFIREIQNYCYRKDKNEEKYHDEEGICDNHIMDALTYSVNDYRKKDGTYF